MLCVLSQKNKKEKKGTNPQRQRQTQEAKGRSVHGSQKQLKSCRDAHGGFLHLALTLRMPSPLPTAVEHLPLSPARASGAQPESPLKRLCFPTFD